MVYGRRRIGKTALVERAFADTEVWTFDGLEGATAGQQRVHFIRQLAACAGKPKLRDEPVRDWHDALDLLVAELSARPERPLVLFFDEFQWLAGMRSTLVSLFKSYWDSHLSKRDGLRVVLCGSVSSFMVKKVLRSRALYGRVSTEIHLGPLSLGDTARFFGGARDPQEVLEIAMTFGCIPQYLKELDPKLSLVQNLREHALTAHGFFFGEYQRIFVSHFGRNPLYEKTIRQLSRGPLAAGALTRAVGTKSGGTFTMMLDDLELAGFIEHFAPMRRTRSRRRRRSHYRILDEYLHFFFTFIEPIQHEIRSGAANAPSVFSVARYQRWRGLAFERLCRRYQARIADALRFSGIQYRAGSWFTGGSRREPGAQVDLLFERADRVLTVCEAKHAERLNALQVIRAMDGKCAALAREFPRHGIQRVLVLGQSIEVPDRVRRAFDEVLLASGVLFD